MKFLLKTIPAIFMLLLLGQSCSVTHLASEYDCDAIEGHPEYEKTTCSYIWGLLQPKDIDANCCDTCAINQVEVVNQFDHTLVTIVTLGIVIPQKIKWCCQPENPPMEDLD